MEVQHYSPGHSLKPLAQIKAESIEPKKRLENLSEEICKYDQETKMDIEKRRALSLNNIKATFEKLRNTLFIKELELSFEMECFFDRDKEKSNNITAELKRDLENKIYDLKHIAKKDLLFKETLSDDIQNFINNFPQEMQKAKNEMELKKNTFQQDLQQFPDLLEDFMKLSTQLNEEKSRWNFQTNITCSRAAIYLNMFIENDKLIIQSDNFKPSRNTIHFEALKQVKEIQIELLKKISEEHDLQIVSYIFKKLGKMCPSLSLKLHRDAYSEEFDMILNELCGSFQKVKITLEDHRRVTADNDFVPLLNKIMSKDKEVSLILNNSWLDLDHLRANNFEAFDTHNITQFTCREEYCDRSICDFFFNA